MIVMSASLGLLNTPNAPVMSLSWALTHGSAIVSAQALAAADVASAASAAVSSEAQAVSRPIDRMAAAGTTRWRRMDMSRAPSVRTDTPWGMWNSLPGGGKRPITQSHLTQRPGVRSGRRRTTVSASAAALTLVSMADQERTPDLSEVSLMDAFGGRRGVLDSGLPPLTFVSTYLISGSNLTVALIAALVAGLVVTGWRLATHDTLRHALAGFGAVALAAFVASRTGRPQDYFLPSLLANAGAALAWAISIWVKRPFLGLVVGGLTRSSAWRTDPVMLAAYCRASWIWVASFLVRVAVMTPLWLAGMTVALGLAKVALGWPMVLVVIWLSWLVVEPAHRARRQSLAAERGDA